MDVIEMMENAVASDDKLAKDTALNMAAVEIDRLREVLRNVASRANAAIMNS